MNSFILMEPLLKLTYRSRYQYDHSNEDFKSIFSNKAIRIIKECALDIAYKILWDQNHH